MKIPSDRSDADRRLRQADRLARVLRVLQLLQSRARWNAKSIAQELECSERTFYRDREVLELAGVPLTYDKEWQCYRLRPDYSFPVLSLSDEEVVGLATANAATHAKGLNIDAGAEPTTEKYLAVRPDATDLFGEASNLTQILDLKLVDHSKHLEIIRTIQWALIERKQITGKYHSPHESGPVTLTLHPFRLCLVKSAWYVVARPVDADQPITLRPTRFKSVRMIDEPAEIPDDFDLAEYFGNAWAVYRGEQTYDIKLLFTAEAADVVTETQWHHTQTVKRHKNGTATLSFHVDGLNEIVRWVVGWAGRVKVIQPEELRELVIDQHRRAIEHNSSR